MTRTSKTKVELRRALEAHVLALVDAAIDARLVEADTLRKGERSTAGPLFKTCPQKSRASIVGTEDLPTALSRTDKKRVHVYVAGSRGAAGLARLHGEKIFKIGTTTQSVDMRLKEIGRDRYGATVRRGDRVVIQPGFEAWVAQMIHVTRSSILSSVSLSARSICVDLPSAMTTRGFDKALHSALSARAISAAGLDRRFTSYAIGSTDRISEAGEFYAYDPSIDGDMLLDVVEAIVDHRCGTHSRGQARRT